jgi:transposase-like protein
MSKQPRKTSPEKKLQIVLEALRNEKTIIQLASEHDVHPKQIQRWRNQLLNEAESLFADKRTQKQSDPDKEQLLHVIGQLQVELEFLRKKLQRDG